MFANRLGNAVRRFNTSSVVRSGDHGYGGEPGENLPFKLGGPVRMTALFISFFALPLAAPFLIVRHQMLKK